MRSHSPMTGVRSNTLFPHPVLTVSLRGVTEKLASKRIQINAPNNASANKGGD